MNAPEADWAARRVSVPEVCRLNLWLMLEGHLLNDDLSETMTESLRVYGEALDDGSFSELERLSKALVFTALMTSQAQIYYSYLRKTRTSIPHAKVMAFVEKVMTEQILPAICMGLRR
jgi:hypothetical protein